MRNGIKQRAVNFHGKGLPFTLSEFHSSNRCRGRHALVPLKEKRKRKPSNSIITGSVIFLTATKSPYLHLVIKDNSYFNEGNSYFMSPSKKKKKKKIINGPQAFSLSP